jgi:hypothetical protein
MLGFTMFPMMTLIALISLVVLGALVACSGRSHRSLGLAMIGLMGVIFGGPSAMLVLAAQGEPADAQPDVVVEKVVSQDAVAPDGTVGIAAEADLDDAIQPQDSGSPQPRFAYPPDRPSWVDSDPVREGTVDRIFVSSGPHYLRRDSLHALDEELEKVTDEYIEQHLGEGATRYVNYDLKFIKSRLVDPSYNYGGVIQFDFAPMREEHRALAFDQSFRDELDSRWNQVKATSRLIGTGLVGGGILALLGTLFSFFKLDTATRGFYTGRLQFAAIAVILALVAAGVLLASRVPWM